MSSLSQQLPGRGAAERLLLREFSHRINNELASAISLVSVAASRCTSNEARAALAAVRIAWRVSREFIIHCRCRSTPPRLIWRPIFTSCAGPSVSRRPT